MRVESMVAQQAVLAASTRQAARGPRAEHPERSPEPAAGQGADTALPSAIANRLAAFFASDPGFAAAVSAQLPAARRASARDMAAYGRTDHPKQAPRLIDIAG
jgi:hypothetical protein